MPADDAKAIIFAQIVEERARQDAKWGADRVMPNDRWNTILGEETGEVSKEVLERNREKLRAELIQVAAVTVAWIEALDGGRDISW